MSYGIGLIGLIVSACLYLHVAAKYLFVRFLRNSRHLQANTVVHWGTWLGCTFGLASISFILSEAVPIFNYLIALTGSICFAPLALCLPGWLWLYDHGHYRTGNVGQQVAYWLHWALILLGAFLCVGGMLMCFVMRGNLANVALGTYGVVQEISDAYAEGIIGKFSLFHECIDWGIF